MSTFEIKVLPGSRRSPEGDRVGRITVGDFSEEFPVSPSPEISEVYSLPQLWRSALSDLLAGTDAIALRTQPRRAWVLYRVGSLVHVQDHLLVPDWGGELDPEGRITALPQRESRTEAGNAISEWNTSIEAIRSFLASD